MYLDTSVDDTVLTESVGVIRVLRLNRPDKLNAADVALQRRFLARVKDLSPDHEARVALVAGNGRAFCAGGDRTLLHASMEGRLPHKEELGRIQVETIRGMLRLSIPTIAAVNGAAVGNGAGLAALCDVVVIAEDGFLWDPHVKYGLAASPPTQLMWPRLTSLSIAKDLLMSGRKVHAQEAVSLGLAQRISPPGRALELAMEIASGFSAMPAGGLVRTKRALNRSVLDELSTRRLSDDGVFE